MKHQMTLKIESNQEKHFYIVDEFYPLSLADFDNEVSKIKFLGKREHFIKNQPTEAGFFELDVKHNLSKNAFILSDRGWLPPAYCIAQQYLLDRNVVSTIEGNDLKHYSLFLEWFNVIKNSNKIQFSTLFSAIEKHGDFPDLISFHNNIKSDAKILKDYFNECQILDLNDDTIENFYAFIKDLRLENLINFIINASKIIIEQKPKSDRRVYAEEILRIAKMNKLNGKIHLVILSLSCLYAGKSSFARNIIKPKNLVSDNPKLRQSVMNCINDTIFIDLILLMKKHVSQNFSGITLDKGLAQYWCALNPKIDEEQKSFIYSYDISSQLFNTASQADLEFLHQSLNEL